MKGLQLIVQKDIEDFAEVFVSKGYFPLLICTDSIKNNFSAALFNRRGSSIRGAFDGGDIEREHANYFSELANRYKNKYPTVAKIFRDLSTNYLTDAKQMDNRAKKGKLDYL